MSGPVSVSRNFSLGSFNFHLIVDQASEESAPVATLVGSSERWVLSAQGVAEPARSRTPPQGADEVWIDIGAEAADQQNGASGSAAPPPVAPAAPAGREGGAYGRGGPVERAVAAAAPRLGVEPFVWREPRAALLAAFVAERGAVEVRLRLAYECGVSDALVAVEHVAGRFVKSRKTILEGKTATVYGILRAPEQGIAGPCWTYASQVFRRAVAPAHAVPAATGRILYSDECTARGFWNRAELRAYFAGAGLTELPFQRV